MSFLSALLLLRAFKARLLTFDFLKRMRLMTYNELFVCPSSSEGIQGSSVLSPVKYISVQV